MPIVFSSAGASAVSEKVLWVDEYISRADSGLLTPTTKSFGFKTYIPLTAVKVINLGPVDYLSAFREQLAKSPLTGLASCSSTTLEASAEKEADLQSEKVVDMAEPVTMQTPSIAITTHGTNHSPERPSPTTRKSATMHKTFITKLRPLPFQYVWTVYHEKSISASSSSSSNNTASSPTATNYTDRLTTLSSSVPDIAEFYKIFNNIPWSSIPSRSSIHIFRSGVQPVWEHPENISGGCFTLKVRKPTQPNNPADDASDRPRRVWEEICLMGCGGELQSAVVEAGSRDHVLGMSFSPRLYWVHIFVWMKGVGVAEKGWQAVQKTVLERLSPELRPRSEMEYYYKRHDEHEGWAEAVAKVGLGK